MKRVRVLAVTAGILVGLTTAAPARALSPPELFVRMQPWDTHEAVSDWIPLASAPALDYLGGYEIGYRLQASGEPNELQRVALTIAGVPDGRPSQPSNAEPYCVTRAGAAGSIVAAGPELQFEGDGAYTVRVSVGPSAGGATGCLSGPSTTGTFSAGSRVVPGLSGSPLSFRAVPPGRDGFIGLRAPDPPGGQADIRCALDATVQPDGSVAGSIVAPDDGETHATVPEDAFPRPGVWTCAARGTAEGLGVGFERTVFGGSWSAPLVVEVRSDFRRRSGTLSSARARRPRFAFRAEWPAYARGGRVTVTLYRVTGCNDRDYRVRKVGRSRGRFGARRARVAIRRPRRPGYYLGRFAFAGTHFLRASVDPAPMFLVATRRRFGFARNFARCPGYLPPARR